MKARLPGAAIAAALLTPAAYAQEAQPAHPGRDAAAQSGFRIEALGGFDTDGYENGTLYGGRIGYDFRVDRRLLIGVDAEYSDVTTDQHLALTTTTGLTAEDGPEYYVGARATFVVSSRLRLHGAGGYTRTREGYFYQSDPNPAPFGTIAAGRESFDGFRFGLGGQVLLGRNAFLGAEYRYSNYGGAFARDREQVVGSIGFRF